MYWFLLRKAAARICVGAMTLLSLSGAALAQGFSSRPITIVVPFVAGSPTDVVARVFATDFGLVLDTPVIVDNRPGANQTVAGSFVSRAAADGNTLFFANLPAVAPPSIQNKLPYKGLRDFAPVSDILTIGFMLVASPSVQANSLKEFMAMLKADPSKYSYGSSGISTPIHLMAEMFNKDIGVKTLHVPYKGGNQVQLDLMSDRVTYAFLPTGSMDFVRSGKLKGFGLAAEKRDPAYPELPTMEEAGLPGFKATVRFVLLAPRQTPAEVVAKLNAAANKVISNEAFYSKVKSVGGIEVSKPATPAQVGAQIAREEEMWEAVVRKAEIQLE
ncbi:Tripartite-type tricarboxylate transporter, receptor component TctC [Variovorax sp. HW608]|uniref:Bug family tripartite tricarboxylate transporter substrate binding protein n=1 Tax=Variovorax sp. HW608 TaxID=1034889 RepID=UPI00081F8950|nr:tripartite tricarboxylate transporter substrate-binding protein [Variovorax sp. HW608]SCK19086.1 Tripartite-type tricarboxylate transporter, receptor component TctC [Variovorax sp. HW608]